MYHRAIQTHARVSELVYETVLKTVANLDWGFESPLLYQGVSSFFYLDKSERRLAVGQTTIQRLSQAVRHQTLTLTFTGSIPVVAAIFSVDTAS